ncbi:MAG: hypothetical protein Ct9H90mP25_5570 [Gammaproteobacteria bacterium]|nr:MAG: hypothetical protein Ct9H90mP25_5570 [Gammaproteobacteria bacterium]
MIITKKVLPRRAILRGIGASVALPLLDAMVPALGQSSKLTEPVGPVWGLCVFTDGNGSNPFGVFLKKKAGLKVFHPLWNH